MLVYGTAAKIGDHDLPKLIVIFPTYGATVNFEIFKPEVYIIVTKFALTRTEQNCLELPLYRGNWESELNSSKVITKETYN